MYRLPQVLTWIKYALFLAHCEYKAMWNCMNLQEFSCYQYITLWNKLWISPCCKINNLEYILKFLFHNFIIWCNKTIILWYFTMLCNISTILEFTGYSWIMLFTLLNIQHIFIVQWNINFTILWNHLFWNSQECIFKFFFHSCIIWCNKSMISWYFTMLFNIKFMS